MFTRAIVRPPAANFSQGLTTTAGFGAPDYQEALKQHEAYCVALEQCGLTLTRLEPDPYYPDSTFVEDVAVLICALPHGRATAPTRGYGSCAILTRPGAPSRTGEVARVRQTMADFFERVFEIQVPGTLDGGDICQVGNHFFIGISERTNKEGARQLAKLLEQNGYTSSFIQITKSAPEATDSLLHLKSGLAYLGDRRLVITAALENHAEFAAYDVVRVDRAESYAANCIRVNDQVLIARGYPKFEEKLKELDYQTIALDMTEFQKMDGGLSCLSLRF